MEKTKRTLIVIGGTAAGMSAASNAKRRCPQMEVIVFERTGYISYGSCGLPYFIGGMIDDPQDLASFTPQQARDSRGIDVREHTEVESIDTAAKTVTAKNLETGAVTTCSYTDLVIATGARPIVLSVPGRDLPGIYTVRTVEDGISIKQATAISDGNIAIIGAGFIGLEMAAELSAPGRHITVIEAMPRLLPAFPESYAAMLQKELEENGVELKLGANVTGFEGTDRVEGVRLSDGSVCPASVVILSVGVVPNSEIADVAGIRLGEKCAIAVDPQMRTNLPNVWACGDCAETRHLLKKDNAYIPLGTTANKQGRLAGLNVCGANLEFSGVLGSQVTKVFDLYAAATGFSEAQAIREGFDAVSTAIVKSDRASYYPGGKDNCLTLVFERSGGRLLGAQGIGNYTIAGRINVLATAITAKMTIAEVEALDLVYAPPVAPVYDPILVAARQASKQVKPALQGSA